MNNYFLSIFISLLFMMSLISAFAAKSVYALKF